MAIELRAPQSLQTKVVMVRAIPLGGDPGPGTKWGYWVHAKESTASTGRLACLIHHEPLSGSAL